MNTSSKSKIVESVAADYQWKAEDIRVDEVAVLGRANCTFFTAAQTVRPVATQPNYAVLPGDDVVGSGLDSLAKILNACGADAPALWHAEIVTRFHPELGAGVVLVREGEHFGALEKLKAAGKMLAPPTMVGTVLTFFLFDAERFQVFSVKATRDAGGRVAVEKVLVG